jgi:Na+/H+ antiporter NhaC
VQFEGVRFESSRSEPVAVPIPPLEKGELVLESDLVRGHRLLLSGELTASVRGGELTAERRVHVLPAWVSLLPAVVAIGLAVWLQNVLVSLFLAIWLGFALLIPSDEASWPVRAAQGFLNALDDGLIRQLVPADGETTHSTILLFTLFLGSMVGVMSASGGSAALVQGLSPFTRSRRGGQTTAWALGLVIFFDDYANSLLLGSTLRPVTDRLRISREKLSFIIDSTAAPVAGLAIVSTWVGFEVGVIGEAFARLAATTGADGTPGDAYSIFLATLPYRYYPLLMLVFVFLVGWTGRDFGPMWRAEHRALQGLSPPMGGMSEVDSSGVSGQTGREPGTVWNAVVPLAVLFGVLVAGFWWTGTQGLEAHERTLWRIVGAADSNRVLLVSSFLASVSGVLTSCLTRRLTLSGAMSSWLTGAQSMLPGCCILVLAWSIAMVCDADHLQTAGCLIEWTTGRLEVTWLPLVTFLLSSVVAFATGSSWATMGLLIPLVVSLAFALLLRELGSPTAAMGGGFENHPLMLASLGSVLAGAIFGDHCSPISDTTVLSSLAADCDHLAHVVTQLPYALLVAGVSIVVGVLPAGWGWSPGWSLVLGVLVMWGVDRLLFRTVA